MARVMVKVVPDAAPNAEGTWLNRRVPAWVLEPSVDPGRVADKATRIAVGYGGGRFALLTRHCAPEGHHVVAYRRTRGKRVVRRTTAEAMRQLGHEMRRASVSVTEALEGLSRYWRMTSDPRTGQTSRPEPGGALVHRTPPGGSAGCDERGHHPAGDRARVVTLQRGQGRTTRRTRWS